MLRNGVGLLVLFFWGGDCGAKDIAVQGTCQYSQHVHFTPFADWRARARVHTPSQSLSVLLNVTSPTNGAAALEVIRHNQPSSGQRTMAGKLLPKVSTKRLYAPEVHPLGADSNLWFIVQPFAITFEVTGETLGHA
uniref:Putative secreted protein n=1 Tax=Anopheles triannulatus TaxID=58253 RepID=A0A2M4B345_9DIPT